MISVYKLKPKFQDLIRPLAVKLNKWGITPNSITVLAVVLSAFIGYSLYRQADYRMALLMVPFLYLLRMVLNALDGIIAKEFNKQSSVGEILNEMGDVISDVLIFIGLLGFKDVNLLILIGFISLSIINEFSGVLSKNVYGKRTYHGPMGKSDRALILGAFCVLNYFFASLEMYLSAVLACCCILIILSSYKRLSIRRS